MLKNTTIYSALILIICTGCKKEYDLPPVKPVESLNKINIANIKAKYTNNINYQFKSDSALYCVVTADETSGNLFKEIYVKDVTGALHVKLTASGGLFTGDSIRINLKGAILNEYNKLVQLDSVDSEKSIIKLASGYNPQPVTLSITQVLANTAPTNSVQSKLVRINNIEFATADQGQAFADPANKSTVYRVIKSCSGEALTIRTSGYSNFAGKLTPTGNGSITGIIIQNGASMQMIIRNYNEVNMTGKLCAMTNTNNTAGATYLSKDFNDNSVASGGWSVQHISASIPWSTSTTGSSANPYCQVKNYISGANVACESWLISPALNLTAASNPVLSFRNAYNYTGDVLKCYVSTNYTAGSPASATWTALNFNASAGSFAFVSSGNIMLNLYKSNNTRIAFKYTGSATSGSTWELDDILVKEN